jgi:formylglycine-generating enzyme required for sulfatase activity
MEFVKISPIPFTMGSLTEYDEAQRPVTLTQDFEMMTTEVTQSMYFEVTGKNPSHFKNRGDCPFTFTSAISHTTGALVTLCPNNPVEKVSYNDVQSFIAILNAKTGMNYRLPTEAEWEYAARAGSYSDYSFGDNPAYLGEYGIYSANSDSKTHPVAPLRSYANKPNAFGLYDMHGNVWEWVQDWYTSSPVGGINPMGPTTGSYRVIRGGSWNVIAQFLRSAYRHYYGPSSRYGDVGFRLVRTLH